MSEHPLIGIDYDEFAPETYRAVTLRMPGMGEAELRLTESGGPIADFRAAVDVARNAPQSIMFRSSVDHFISDLPPASEQREDLIALRDNAPAHPNEGDASGSRAIAVPRTSRPCGQER